LQSLTVNGAGRAIAGATLLICAGAPAHALDCPWPQPAGRPGVIAQTPDQIRELSKVFVAGGESARIPVIIADVRKRHPDAEAATIVNYLITAYCPVVQDMANLSEKDKAAKLDAFSAQVLKYLY
jgi:hypothetical protein